VWKKLIKSYEHCIMIKNLIKFNFQIIFWIKASTLSHFKQMNSFRSGPHAKNLTVHSSILYLVFIRGQIIVTQTHVTFINITHFWPIHVHDYEVCSFSRIKFPILDWHIFAPKSLLPWIKYWFYWGVNISLEWVLFLLLERKYK
jgi:hypothetical protein